MIPDIRFESDVLRAALLLGLIREHEVIGWADAFLATEPDPYGLLADVALARPELTTLREALRPLSEPEDAEAVGHAILAFIAADSAVTRLNVPDRIRTLGLLRRELPLPGSVSDRIKLFEDRAMLAAVGVNAESAPSAAEIATWLDVTRPPCYYRISMVREDESAALLGALSRALVRDRRWARVPSHGGGKAWMVKRHDGASTMLVVDDALWRIAGTAFSPLPLGSRLPYPSLPGDATLVLDQETAAPMGALEASDFLAGIGSNAES
jgi:hypothetical protein